MVDTSGGGEGNSRPAAGERGVSGRCGRAGRRCGLPAGGEVGQGEFVGRSRRAAGVLGKQVNGTREASRGKAVASYGACVGENRVVSGPGGLWRRGPHPGAGCGETRGAEPFLLTSLRVTSSLGFSSRCAPSGCAPAGCEGCPEEVRCVWEGSVAVAWCLGFLQGPRGQGGLRRCESPGRGDMSGLKECHGQPACSSPLLVRDPKGRRSDTGASREDG